MQADTVVFDIDGTLADISHRIHYIQKSPPDYDAFFAHVGGDRLNVWCAELIAALHPKYRVILISGRPVSTREDTERWLVDNNVPYHELVLVRGNKDYRPDDQLKREWLKKHGKERILFTVDDRQRVVDMWRDEGLVCLQCDAWTEVKRPRPRHEAPPKRLSQST